MSLVCTKTRMVPTRVCNLAVLPTELPAPQKKEMETKREPFPFFIRHPGLHHLTHPNPHLKNHIPAQLR